jgi:uncharacterized cupredoxin-like copper-binding protein
MHKVIGAALKVVALVAILAALSGCAPRSGADVKTVTIRIEHSRFQPARLELPAGATVRFVLRNTDPIDHEFIVGDERVQQVHERGSERHHGAKPGEISVPALEQRSTMLTLEEPGSLIFGCHLPGHYAYGMRGEIEIS